MHNTNIYNDLNRVSSREWWSGTHASILDEASMEKLGDYLKLVMIDDNKRAEFFKL